MSFLQPVQCSNAWYEFVSQSAIKDPQVLSLAKEYIAAMNKLNARLVELAKANPALNSLSISPAANSQDAVQSVQQFHASHGVSYTAEELIADAKQNGITTVSMS